MFSSEGDDTLRGNDGDDRLEGGDGDDNLIGGLGDDILTDLRRRHPEGRRRQRHLSSGQGSAATSTRVAWATTSSSAAPTSTETFGGPGDDYVFAGDVEDTVFGDDGDDWIEGGGQADLLQGDNGAPFQNDPNEPGHDVIIGDGGDDDYDSEGGDDIMVAGTGIQRDEGMLGFDWVTHKGDPQAADDDMFFTGLLPDTLDNLRDRFDLNESLSGWNLNDILRGDNSDGGDGADNPTLVPDNVLTNEGIDRITGLRAFLQDALGSPVTSFAAGNIIIGGEGSDILEGRGGDDVIDGDRWLNVQIEAPDLSTPDPADVKRVDSMGAVQADILAGRMHAGQLRIVRSIVTPAGQENLADVAQFSGPQADYDITGDLANGSATVVHARNNVVINDGTDRLRNIERLLFADGILQIVNMPGNTPATGSVTLSSLAPAENQALTATRAFNDNDIVNLATVAFNWQALINGNWTSVATGTSFTPGDGVVGSRLRVIANFNDSDVPPQAETVMSLETAPVTNVNDVPTGNVVIDDATPTQGNPLTGSENVLDDDGLPATLSYQWQQSDLGGAGAFNGITGANSLTFTPGPGQVNRRLVLRVFYTDDHGTLESVTSPQTGVVGLRFTGTGVAETVTGTAGSDVISGGGGNDIINAGAGPDTIIGGPGNDTIDAGAGADVMQGSGTGDGADAVTGNAGVDRIEATVANTDIGISSVATVENVTADGFAGVRIVGSANADTLNFSAVTLTGITAINGLGGNDTLTGSAAADRINGAAGDDVLDGAGGNDTLVVGPIATMGSDALTGGAGIDTVDTAQTTIGLARLQTVESLETDAAGGAPLHVLGTAAANVLDLSTLTDTEVADVDGGAGDDTITGAGEPDDFRGGDGNDTINTGAAADRATGGAGNDTITTAGGADIVAGNAGDDAINAGAGADVVRFTGTGDGADAVNGGTEIDRVEATAANTAIGLSSLAAVEQVANGPQGAPGFAGVRVVGSAAANTLNYSRRSSVALTGIGSIDGLAGADTLTGTANADQLIGSDGADNLNGLAGADTLDGGAGNDTHERRRRERSVPVRGRRSAPTPCRAFSAAVTAANGGPARPAAARHHHRHVRGEGDDHRGRHRRDAGHRQHRGGGTVTLVGVAPANVTAAATSSSPRRSSSSQGRRDPFRGRGGRRKEDMPLTRRDLIKLGALGSAALLLPVERGARAQLQLAARLDPALLPAVGQVPFRVPPNAVPTPVTVTVPGTWINPNHAAGEAPVNIVVDYYESHMRQVAVPILPGLPPTNIWGYQGITPGPTIHAERGRPVIVRFFNDMTQPAPRAALYPGQLGPPARQRLAAPARRLRERPHPAGQLQGLLVPGLRGRTDALVPRPRRPPHGIEHVDGTRGAVPPPRCRRAQLRATGAGHGPDQYGNPYDVPLILRDALFDSGAQLIFQDNDESGSYGDVILVNGVPWPKMLVEPRQYRFRILDAAASRSFDLALTVKGSTARLPLIAVATDAGIMEIARSTQRLRIASAERYEVVIDFAGLAGRTLRLHNLKPENNIDFPTVGAVMEFQVGTTVTKTGKNNTTDGKVLRDRPDVMKLTPNSSTPRREFVFNRDNSHWTISNQTWADVVASNFQALLATATAGQPEVWTLKNLSGGWFHPIHIHLIDFKILSRTVGKNPGIAPYERGPKDVVYLGENDTIEVIGRFGPADRQVHDALPQRRARGPRHDAPVPRAAGQRHGAADRVRPAERARHEPARGRLARAAAERTAPDAAAGRELR